MPHVAMLCSSSSSRQQWEWRPARRGSSCLPAPRPARLNLCRTVCTTGAVWPPAAASLRAVLLVHRPLCSSWRLYTQPHPLHGRPTLPRASLSPKISKWPNSLATDIIQIITPVAVRTVLTHPYRQPFLISKMTSAYAILPPPISGSESGVSNVPPPYCC